MFWVLLISGVVGSYSAMAGVTTVLCERADFKDEFLGGWFWPLSLPWILGYAAVEWPIKKLAARAARPQLPAAKVEK